MGRMKGRGDRESKVDSNVWGLSTGTMGWPPTEV